MGIAGGVDAARIVQLLIDSPAKYKADIEAYKRAEQASLDATNKLIGAQEVDGLKTQAKKEQQKTGELLAEAQKTVSSAKKDGEALISDAKQKAADILARATEKSNFLETAAANALSAAQEEKKFAEAAHANAKALEAISKREIDAAASERKALMGAKAQMDADRVKIEKAMAVMQGAIGG